jgi:adenylate kinase
VNIALLGPTGSGKGTLIKSLAEASNLHPVALGDVLRQKAVYGTALGILTREYVQNGELVPDEFVDAMIEEVFRHLPAGIDTVLDGFPRTAAQARFLDDLLAELDQSLDAAIYLHVPEKVIFDRVALRMPPRHDDEPHILRLRLHIFRRTVAPVLKYFVESNRLIVLPSDGPLGEVAWNLARVIGEIRAGRIPEMTERDHALLDPMFEARPAAPVAPEPALNLVLLGGPGSGKGTQAEHLSSTFKLPHISTGDLFRESLRRESQLGLLAKSFMNRGELVPDEVTERMVAARLAENDAQHGFILDGFPRTVAQAEALDEILHALNRKVTGVIHVNVSDDEIIRRLSGRRICRQCKASYHLLFNKPRREGVCNRCGGELYQRDDDKPETIQVRLRNYHRQTEPLMDYYRRAGVLTDIDGEGDLRAIRAAMLAAARLFSDEASPATP